ncbi:hypothetical protein R1sor_016361 [Riccia sorocarpa]|uniref:Uncharacterized protein n=1 Tax=Riccia sorocarpa TaxID=122646 RepID=A0ABD3HHJ5_9MARC
MKVRITHILRDILTGDNTSQTKSPLIEFGYPSKGTRDIFGFHVSPLDLTDDIHLIVSLDKPRTLTGPLLLHRFNSYCLHRFRSFPLQSSRRLHLTSGFGSCRLWRRLDFWQNPPELSSSQGAEKSLRRMIPCGTTQGRVYVSAAQTCDDRPAALRRAADSRGSAQSRSKSRSAPSGSARGRRSNGPARGRNFYAAPSRAARSSSRLAGSRGPARGCRRSSGSVLGASRSTQHPIHKTPSTNSPIQHPKIT